MTAVFLTLLLFSATVIADRPKILVKLSDIPIGSCGNQTLLGLGIMDGGLEECNRWILVSTSANQEYEKYKCKKFRVHASVVSGKCVCDENFKGPICNELIKPCASNLGKFRCTPISCLHNGTLAVGSNRIECICPVPWEGSYCERLSQR